MIDRQTDHATWSVTIGRIYVRSTATRPNMVKVFCIRRHILPHMDGLVVLARWRQWTHPTQLPKLHLDGRGLFSRATTEYLYSSYTLQLAAHFLLTIAASHGPQSNALFLGPTRIHSLNGISIGSTVFAGLTIVTDRQTDRQTDWQTTQLRLYQ